MSPLALLYGQGIFYVFPALYAQVHKYIILTVLTAPFGQRFSNAIDCIFQRIAPIVVLNCARFPNTISRLVIPVIVFALNSQLPALWFQSHVFQKYGKIMPRWMDNDTASAIVWIRFICFAVTSRHHVRMTPIFGCPRSAVSNVTRFQRFITKTSARSRMASCQLADAEITYSTTFTKTFPASVPRVTTRRFLKNSQTTKFVSGRDLDSRGFASNINIRFVHGTSWINSSEDCSVKRAILAPF